MIVVFLNIGVAEVTEKDMLATTKPAFESFLVDDEGGGPIVVRITSCFRPTHILDILRV